MRHVHALAEPVARISVIVVLCLACFVPAVGAQEPGDPPALSVESLPEALEAMRTGTQGDLRKALEGVETAHDESLWIAVGEKYPADEGDAYSDDQKAKFRTALSEAWVQALAKAVQGLKPALDRERLTLLNRTGADDARVGALNVALREHESEVIGALNHWVRDGGTVPPRLSEFDPGAESAISQAGAILSSIIDELAAKFAALWAVATSEIVAEYRPPTADQDQAEDDYYSDLQKDTGFSRTVRCAYTPASEKPASLVCAPGLLVSAADIAEIVVRGLPTDRPYRVVALASEDQAGTLDTHHVPHAGSAVATACRPRSDGAVIDPFCDQITVPAGYADRVFVSVYKNRRVFPLYGAGVGTDKAARNAFAALRLPPSPLAERDRRRLNLSILVSGGAAQTLVCVSPERGEQGTACASIPIGYQRWSVETGGFLAVSTLTDQQIVTQPDPDDQSKVQVLSVRDDGNYAQETGLWVSFVPRNYPSYGLGVGLVSDSDRPLSIYLGGSLRLRTFGHRGLASLNYGFAMRSIDRFDNFKTCRANPSGATCGNGFALSGNEGDPNRVLTLPETSPLLDAQQDYHTGPFVAIHLGFSFGPIPGPPDDGN